MNKPDAKRNHALQRERSQRKATRNPGRIVARPFGLLNTRVTGFRSQISAQVPDWAGLFEVMDADGSGTLQWDELREGVYERPKRKRHGNDTETTTKRSETKGEICCKVSGKWVRRNLKVVVFFPPYSPLFGGFGIHERGGLA